MRNAELRKSERGTRNAEHQGGRRSPADPSGLFRVSRSAFRVRGGAVTVWDSERATRALGVPGPRGLRFPGGVGTDTRHLTPGSLFVALQGDRFDAHAFLDQAKAQGAAASVVRAGTPAVEGLPFFEVADTLAALGLLARARRRLLPPGSPVVGVTGSSGKTSTKEMIRAVLATTYRVHATGGNRATLVGVRRTILAAPRDTEALVIEAGASVPGEIPRLRSVIEPTIAVITNVGYAHVAGFGSLAGVMREKLALVEGTRVAVVGTDPPELAREARRRAPTVVAGTGPGADVRPDLAELDDEGHPRTPWRWSSARCWSSGLRVPDCMRSRRPRSPRSPRRSSPPWGSSSRRSSRTAWRSAGGCWWRPTPMRSGRASRRR